MSYASVTKYNYTGDFKKFYSLETRKYEGQRVKDKFPDRIPIIVEQERDTLKVLLDKRKYLVPLDMTVGQFMYVIRKRLKLEPQKALYMFFNGGLSPVSAKLETLYNEHKDTDHFLYCVIGAEKTFG
tara:strand:- start:220 stop:600 length:381 start_codon:yes stop_codon:yes gene_type:complete